jgi:hypothetical protein
MGHRNYEDTPWNYQRLIKTFLHSTIPKQRKFFKNHCDVSVGSIFIITKCSFPHLFCYKMRT